MTAKNRSHLSLRKISVFPLFFAEGDGGSWRHNRASLRPYRRARGRATVGHAGSRLAVEGRQARSAQCNALSSNCRETPGAITSSWLWTSGAPLVGTSRCLGAASIERGRGGRFVLFYVFLEREERVFAVLTCTTPSLWLTAAAIQGMMTT